MSLYLRLWRLFCCLALLTAACPAFAQVQQPLDTTDKFVISDFVTDEDGTYFTVSLEGGDQDRVYCAYNMTITLPLGITFATSGDGMLDVYRNDDTDFYPYSGSGKRKTYYHTVQGALSGTTGRVAKVICSSNTNASFESVSGALFDVYVEVSPWAKAGANEITMTGLNLTTKQDAQKYIPLGDLNTGEIDIPGEDREVSVNIMAANKWGTCILPFDYTPTDGLVALSISENTPEVVRFKPVPVMEAYKPYVLYAENGFTATLTGTASSAAFPGRAVVEDNGLCGVIVPTEVTAGYILQNQGSGVKFYRVGSTPFALPAGRCYLAPDGSSRTSLLMYIESTSGIDEIAPDNDNGGAYYDINGRQLQHPGSGVYIHNSKKIINTK